MTVADAGYFMADSLAGAACHLTSTRLVAVCALPGKCRSKLVNHTDCVVSTSTGFSGSPLTK